MSSDSSDSASPQLSQSAEVGHKSDRAAASAQPSRRKQVRKRNHFSQLQLWLFSVFLPSLVNFRSSAPQVKLACTNCRKAHSACDDIRPCSRCTKYGLTDSCEDKPRRKRTAASTTPGKRSFDEFATSSGSGAGKPDSLAPRMFLLPVLSMIAP